jgi:hypothetical protein
MRVSMTHLSPRVVLMAAVLLGVAAQSFATPEADDDPGAASPGGKANDYSVRAVRSGL